ncbi:MAG: HEPN domain-containing protein [Ginsengibacter sp.]
MALLINKEIETLTHTEARQLFGLYFIKTGVIEKDFGKFYSTLFDLRYTGDYDDFIDSTKEQVLDLLQPAVNLIMKIELIINESDNEDQ